MFRSTKLHCRADVEKRNAVRLSIKFTFEINKVKLLQVEAILVYKIKHKKKVDVSYLIKWKDEYRGETWESSKKALVICPKVVGNYDKELQKANMNQVNQIFFEMIFSNF